MPSNWQHKIQQFETPPPNGAWDCIAKELDKKNNLATKILNYTVPAPKNLWNKIAAALDENKVKSIYFSKTFYLRAVATAAVLTIVFTIVWVVVNKKNDIITSKTIATTTLQKTNTTILKDTAISNIETKIKKENTAKIIVQNKKLKHPITIIPHYLQGNVTNDLAANPSELIKEKIQNTAGQISNDIALMNSPNTYISITGPDGEMVKVSSKFSNLIGYFNNNNTDTQENLDIIISEGAKWRKIFANWRSKMVSANITPSLNNFMDIIELNKLLSDNL